LALWLFGPALQGRASDEGRSMGLEELVAYALEPVPTDEGKPA
jgi:hypothetical protein